MTRFLLPTLTVAAALAALTGLPALASSSGASSEDGVYVEIHDPSYDFATSEPLDTAPETSLFERGNTPSTQFWFVPNFRVDRSAAADTTLWAVRNEEGASIDLTAEYYDRRFNALTTQSFVLPAHAVQTVNIRDVPGLGSGEVRGIVRFAAGGAISADYLQVDTSRNLATGSVAVSGEDFCRNWSVRFASFSPGSGSVLSFLVNGPRGSDISGPPTIIARVYDEAGTHTTSFSAWSDRESFHLNTIDLTGSLNFGSIELEINTSDPGGVVSVAHSAEGRFSAGMRAICLDP